jgi:ankyrin repeat protein
MYKADDLEVFINQPRLRYDDETLLCHSAYDGNETAVKLLVKKGLNINTRFGLPLRGAAGEGHLSIVRFLIESGADVNVDDGGVIRAACKKDRVDVVKYLLGCGANVDLVGDRIAFHISYVGSPEIIKLLIFHGLNLKYIKQEYREYACRIRKRVDVLKWVHSV